jgi:alpha-D-ribose 1-methylphosphonate 5-triphosphate diphosphatase
VRDGGFSLPEAVAVVSRNPARAAGLADRGEIATGLRGDVIRVKALGDHPIAREAWVSGRRVV